VSEHAFDKLQLLDCTFGELDTPKSSVDRPLDEEGSLKELIRAWRGGDICTGR
jgi:hypothetical protein